MRWRIAVLASIVVLVDQVAKWFLAATAPEVAAENQGIVFGFASTTRGVPVVAAAALVGFGSWCRRLLRRGLVDASCVGLLLGGAAANVIDRVALGGVRDVIPIGPLVANPADFAIVAGLVAFLAATWNREVSSSR